jgi:hypothetical protein
VNRNTYIRWAREALIELADLEHAFLRPEAFARISDTVWGDLRKTVDPDLVSHAIDELKAEGVLHETAAPTRGGRTIPVLHFTNLTGRKAAFEAAAKRKRLLQGRYLGWALGTPGNPGIIGPAGEAVVRASLQAARAKVPLLLVNEGREVNHFMGQPVKGGSLDCAGHLLTLDQGIPVPVNLPIEVKNTRGWMFPWSQELFQLLHKAALLQTADLGRHILPFLICRRMQFMTGRMAKELGFFVVGLRLQPILPAVDEAKLQQVRNELGYFDLTPTVDPSETLVTRIETLAADAAKRAERWRLWAPPLLDYFEALREERSDRQEIMNELYDVVRDSEHWEGTWPFPRPEPEPDEEVEFEE